MTSNEAMAVVGIVPPVRKPISEWSFKRRAIRASKNPGSEYRFMCDNEAIAANSIIKKASPSIMRHHWINGLRNSPMYFQFLGIGWCAEFHIEQLKLNI